MHNLCTLLLSLSLSLSLSICVYFVLSGLGFRCFVCFSLTIWLRSSLPVCSHYIELSKRKPTFKYSSIKMKKNFSWIEFDVVVFMFEIITFGSLITRFLFIISVTTLSNPNVLIHCESFVRSRWPWDNGLNYCIPSSHALHSFEWTCLSFFFLQNFETMSRRSKFDS